MSALDETLGLLGLAQQAPVPRASQTTPYLGMDQKNYFGTDLLDYFQAHTNIKWVAGYLDSPAPFPGEITPRPRPGPNAGHNRNGNPVGSWMAGLQEARHSGWGVLPVYFGEQDPANGDGPWDLRAVAATSNAQDAIAKAEAANLDPHCVLYIDYEMGGDPIDDAVAYLKLLFELVAEAGIRPGLYAHGQTTIRLRKEWPDIAGWVTHPSLTANQAITLPVTGTQVVFNGRNPTRSGANADADAIAWQMWFEASTPWPATLVFPAPTAPATFPITFPNGAPGISATGRPRLEIDVSSSSVADPGFPERRCAPGLVRRGRFSAAALDAARVAMLAVRRGALVARTWTATAPATAAAVTLPDGVLAFNPWSAHAISTRGTSGDFAVVARSAAVGTADNAWEIAAYRRRNQTWTIDRTINGTVPVEPLFGLALCSRAADTVEAFFATNDGTGPIFAVSCVDAATQANNQPWSAPVPVNSQAGWQPSLVGGIGAVSRQAGVSDVFVAAQAAADPHWRLFWNSSSILGTWPHFSVPGDPTIELHPFSNVALVSRGPQLVDVFAIGKSPTDANWTLYTWWWNQAESWGAGPPGPAYHTAPIASATVRPHPVSKIAAVSRSLQAIDVFFAGYADGLLYTVSWDGAFWSDFRRVGSSDVTIASVDAAVSRAPDRIDVIVTGRDGNVYVSSWTATATAYSDLIGVTPFDIA